jgi:hypothetical protein
MIFRALIDFCSAEALGNSMEPTEETVWRSYCREYSTKFHTRLDVVMNELDPEFVILQVMESRLENIDHDEHLESIMDSIYSMEDPSYSKDKAAEQQSFDEQAEKEEKERLDRGESLFKHLTRKSVKNAALKMKEILKRETPKPNKLPKSGGLDMARLAHLADEEAEGGFKDDE